MQAKRHALGKLLLMHFVYLILYHIQPLCKLFMPFGNLANCRHDLIFMFQL